MPTYDLNLTDFNRILGSKPTTMKEIEDIFPNMAVVVDNIVDDDTVSVEVFANRPDMLGPEGLSRQFAGFTEREIDLISYDVEETDPIRIIVSPEMKQVRPFVAFTKVTNIDLDDTGLQASFTFHEKLHTTHARQRRKAAIGLYDYKAGNLEAPITFKLVDRAKKKYKPLGESEVMTAGDMLDKTIKGREFAHIIPGDKVPALVDKKEDVLAIIPILNSDQSKVTEKSTEIFVDVTGTDWNTVMSTFNMVLTALADRGAKIHPSIVEYPYDTPGGRIVKLPDFKSRKIKLNLDYVDKQLGKQVSRKKQIDCLKKSRFGVKLIKKGIYEISIPCYRTDILHPIDLVEEIAISYGYSNFEPTIPNVTTVGEESVWQIAKRRITNLLTGTGAYEVMTFMLSNEDNLFTKMELPIDTKQVVVLANPMTSLTTHVRNWILPSMLEVLQRNKPYVYPQKIFEIAKETHVDKSQDSQTRDDWKICIVEAGSESNFNIARSYLSTLELNLGVQFNVKRPKKDIPFLISGRSGEIFFGKSKIGFIGEIHPKVLSNWELHVPIACLEISMKEWLIEIRKSLGLETDF